MIFVAFKIQNVVELFSVNVAEILHFYCHFPPLLFKDKKFSNKEYLLQTNK